MKFGLRWEIGIISLENILMLFLWMLELEFFGVDNILVGIGRFGKVVGLLVRYVLFEGIFRDFKFFVY